MTKRLAAIKEETKYRGLAILISFVLLYTASLVEHVQEFYLDAFYYWNVADGIFTNPDMKFNLLNFPETFRGYFYPFLLSVLKKVALIWNIDPISLYRIVSSILIAVMISVILPYLINIKKYKRRYIVGVLSLSILTIIFWKDFFTYTFSDIPAMLLFLLGTCLVKIVLAKIKNVEWKILQMLQMLILGMFIGIFFYGAYNTRLIYIYAIYGVAVFFIYDVIKQIIETNRGGGGRILKIRQYLFTLLAIFIGSFIVAYPQMVINNQYIGQYTPRVLSGQLFDYKNNLSVQQLFWGLNMTRYDSLVTIQEETGRGFFDTAGGEILRREVKTQEVPTLKKILKIYIKYPFDIIGIYTRHVMSYVTILYDTSFPDVIVISKSHMLFNMVLWIVSVWVFISRKRTMQDIVNYKYLLCVIIPCILLIPGSPEVRFFVGCYFVMYSTLCFQVDFKSLAIYVKENYLVVAGLSLGVFCVWIMYVSNLLQSLVGKIHLIG